MDRWPLWRDGLLNHLHGLNVDVYSERHSDGDEWRLAMHLSKGAKKQNAGVICIAAGVFRY